MSGYDVDAPTLTSESEMAPITPGDDVQFSFSFTDENGNPIDISGWTVWLTVKDDYDDDDANADIQVSTSSHTDPTAGSTSLSFSSNDTDGLSGTKVWDCQVKEGTGEIHTLVEGSVEFGPQVTNTT